MTAVYKAIAAVQGELAKAGIAKEGVNQSQNYKFRGIDQVYGALSPLLAKHGLCVLPRIVSREMHERVTVKPGFKPNDPPKESVLFYVTVEAEFDFVAVEDGSTHVVKTFGEAMDSGDKATNKAMSAAYKYAAFMAFAIPTEGDNDADATTHEVVASQPTKPARNKPEPLKGVMKTRAEARLKYGEIIKELHACADTDMLEAFLATIPLELEQFETELPEAWAGDGNDFIGLKAEIDNARTRCAGEEMVNNMRAG